MAGAYYAPPPHNPNGPCSLAAGLQIAACIPNFMVRGGGSRTRFVSGTLAASEKIEPIPEGGLGITIDQNVDDEVGEPPSTCRNTT